MKKSIFYLAMVLFGGVLTTSCEKDDDTPPVIDNPIYGMQIKGSATDGAVLVLDAKQMVEQNGSFDKFVRTGMMYNILFLKAGEFTFSEVVADGVETYGATETAEVIQEAGNETVDALSYDSGKLVAGGIELCSLPVECIP